MSINWLTRRVARREARAQDKRHARQARRARRRRRHPAATALAPLAAPSPQQPTLPIPQPDRTLSAGRQQRRRTGGPVPGTEPAAHQLAGGLRRALRRGILPRPAPRRNPLPRRPPDLRQRCRLRWAPQHQHPGAATAGRVLSHRRLAPPVLGRENSPEIEGHREPGEDGDVATCACPVHRAERGAVQSRGTQQRGVLRPVRRCRVRVAVPRWLLARLRRRLPRRHGLPSRRDPIDQVAWVLELSERRRPPARRGAGELDGDVLLRLHPVPGEPGEVAQVTARGRRSGSVLTQGTASNLLHCIHPWFSVQRETMQRWR